MNSSQQAVLREIGRHSSPAMQTPREIARYLTVATSTHYSWQGVVRIAGQLERAGLISAWRHPKLTYYMLTDAGRAELGIVPCPDCQGKGCYSDKTACSTCLGTAEIQMATHAPGRAEGGS